MSKSNFAGMRRFQPDPKSSKDLRKKPESPKKRAIGWVNTEERSRSPSVSPKKLILPPSSCVKGARTERWVEESVKVTSQILETSREIEPDEDDIADDHIEKVDISDSSEEDDLLEQQRKRSKEVQKVMKSVAKSKKTVAVATMTNASRPKKPAEDEASKTSGTNIGLLPTKYLYPRREGLDEKEENWVYWRLCSSKVDLVLDKHKTQLRSKYLSAPLVKDIFCPPGVAIDSATASVTLRVTKVPEIFFYGNRGGKRLTITASLLPTSENHKRDEVRVAAAGSLASLLKSEVEEGDVLTIFLQNGPRFSKLILLNSSFWGQETTHVVHHRPQSAVSVRGADYTFVSAWRLKLVSSWSNDEEGTVMIRPLKPKDFHMDNTEEAAKQEEEEEKGMSVDSSASTVDSKSEADPGNPNACGDEPADDNQPDKQKPLIESQKPPESSDPSSRTTLPSSQKSKESSDGAEGGIGVQYPPDAFEQSVTLGTQKETQGNLPGASEYVKVEAAIESDDIVAEVDNFSVYSQPVVPHNILPNNEPSSQTITGISKASNDEPVAKNIESNPEQVPVSTAIDKPLKQPSCSVSTRNLPNASAKGSTVKSKPAGFTSNAYRSGADKTKTIAEVPSSQRSAINTCDLYAGRFTQSSYDEINEDLCKETQFSSNNIVDRIFENVSESPEDANEEDPISTSNVVRTETSLQGNKKDVSTFGNTQSSIQEIHLETQCFPLDCFDDDEDVCDERTCSNGTVNEQGNKDGFGPEAAAFVGSSNHVRKSVDAEVQTPLAEMGREESSSCRIS